MQMGRRAKWVSGNGIWRTVCIYLLVCKWGEGGGTENVYTAEQMSKECSTRMWTYIKPDRLWGLVLWVPGYRSRGPGSIPGPTTFSEKYLVWNGVHSASWKQFRSYLEEKVKASVQKSEKYGRRDTSRWPRGALYPQKLALTDKRRSLDQYSSLADEGHGVSYHFTCQMYHCFFKDSFIAYKENNILYKFTSTSEKYKIQVSQRFLNFHKNGIFTHRISIKSNKHVSADNPRSIITSVGSGKYVHATKGVAYTARGRTVYGFHITPPLSSIRHSAENLPAFLSFQYWTQFSD
jgi:hypothetical protein